MDLFLYTELLLNFLWETRFHSVEKKFESADPHESYLLCCRLSDQKRTEEKRAAEDGMVRWHQQLGGHEFAQTPDIVKERGAGCASVLGVGKRQTRLIN